MVIFKQTKILNEAQLFCGDRLEVVGSVQRGSLKVTLKFQISLNDGKF